MSEAVAKSAPQPTAAKAPHLEAVGLTVGYGREGVLAGLDMAVAPGEVYALLGRNGSGKSTLVRTLLGQQPALAGSARLLGRDAWRHRASLMRRVGVVSEEPQTPPEMTVAGLLAFRRHLDPSWREAVAADRLRRFGVPLATPFGRLSRGQQKQVELSLALAGNPELLVLDDPTLGLDPVARRAFVQEVVGELADSGVTVVLTTHDLAAVEGLADRVGILHQGRLVVDEGIEELRGRFRRLRLSPGGSERLEELTPLAVRRRAWGEEVVVSRVLPGAVAPPGAQPMSLEEIFTALVEGEGEAS